jgi:hypothetical protein
MRSTTACRYLGSFVLCSAMLVGAAADDAVFSGPQPGESLAPFKVLTVLGENSGREIDPVAAADGKPTLLVFVHKLTRPGMALTRGLTAYAKSQSAKGVVSGVIWLDDDQAKAEAYLKRASGSLKFVVPVGVSVDGGEGPGAYGLNRNVELTILVAKDNQVTANFALVQPSVTEAPMIAAALAKLIDQPSPTADEIQKLAYSGRAMATRANMRRGDAAKRPEPGGDRVELREMMSKAIAADASEADLRIAVKAIDEWAGDDKDRHAALGRMADAVLQRGLGSKASQAVLKSWQSKYGPNKPTEGN